MSKEISDLERNEIIDYCERMEKAVQNTHPCFDWKQLNRIKEILL